MLSMNAIEKINCELLKYPPDQKRSAVMSALRIVSQEHGYLTLDAINDVASYLEIPPVQALEVATFYSMYDTKPVGRHKITVCTNLPCSLSGAINVADYLKKRLGINFGETTKDGKFTLVEAECMGACGEPTVVLVNNHKMCSHMNIDKIEQLLTELE